MSEKEAHHSTPSSDPIIGHGGTAYEGHDAPAGVIVWSLVIVAGLVALGFALMLGVEQYMITSHPAGELASPLTPERVIPPAPQLQVHPWEDLPEMRAAEDKALGTTGRDQAGHMHIPIDSAITEVLSRLKVSPNAPQGLYTPGGQGREFSRSITELPGTVRPQIEGEIRKNAK
jgi:hypothetical protein